MADDSETAAGPAEGESSWYVEAGANEEAMMGEGSADSDLGGEEGGDGGDDDDAEEGEEEEEEDDEERLELDGRIDFLAFVEEQNAADAFQQFERLHYETLAERKRKALAAGGGRKKRPRPGEVLDDGGMNSAWGAMGMGEHRGRRKRRKRKVRRAGEGRIPPEVTKKIGDANMMYMLGRFQEAIDMLTDVVRQAPQITDSYHTLGLLYDAIGDRKRALNFFMIAAHTSPKDFNLWKRLASWSTELGNPYQAIYCLSKIVRNDHGEDSEARWDRAMLFAEVGDFPQAALALDKLRALRPADCEVTKMLSRMYHKMGQAQKAARAIEDLLEKHPDQVDLTALNMLAELQMEGGAFDDTIALIERTRTTQCVDKPLPLDLAVKLAICLSYRGHFDQAQEHLEALKAEDAADFGDLFVDVGDMYWAVSKPEEALQFYAYLEPLPAFNKPSLWLKLARCHEACGAREKAIELYQKAIAELPGMLEARITLANLLHAAGRETDAISVLQGPPGSSDWPGVSMTPGVIAGEPAEVAGEKLSWWQSPRIRLARARLLFAQGKHAECVESGLPLMEETIELEKWNLMKLEMARRQLGKTHRTLLAAPKGGPAANLRSETLFWNYTPSHIRKLKMKERLMRKRAEKYAAEKAVAKAAALEAGEDWESESDRELTFEKLNLTELPLPGPFKDDAAFNLVIETCKALVTVERKDDAIYILQTVLQLCKGFGVKRRTELKVLLQALTGVFMFTRREGGQATDKRYNAARFACKSSPYTNSVWNAYHSAATRAETTQTFKKHQKFLLHMRNKHSDCVPVGILCGHHYAVIGHFQHALVEYLRAFALAPHDPFLALCIGVGFLHLAMGSRISNRNLCVLQAFAFLFKHHTLCHESQMSCYNLARAFHQVNLTHLAIPYYERVLSRNVANQKMPPVSTEKNGKNGEGKGETTEEAMHECDLKREAAHNLALAYQASGEEALAKAVLEEFLSV